MKYNQINLNTPPQSLSSIPSLAILRSLLSRNCLGIGEERIVLIRWVFEDLMSGLPSVQVWEWEGHISMGSARYHSCCVSPTKSCDRAFCPCELLRPSTFCQPPCALVLYRIFLQGHRGMSSFHLGSRLWLKPGQVDMVTKHQPFWHF